MRPLVRGGAGYILRLDDGVTHATGPGGGAAVLSRIRAGSAADPPPMVRPDIGSWHQYLPATTKEGSQYAGLIVGLTALFNVLQYKQTLHPPLQLLIVQGDPEFVLNQMQGKKQPKAIPNADLKRAVSVAMTTDWCSTRTIGENLEMYICSTRPPM